MAAEGIDMKAIQIKASHLLEDCLNNEPFASLGEEEKAAMRLQWFPQYMTMLITEEQNKKVTIPSPPPYDPTVGASIR